jgi:tetratricopeptide (TPR) repeat protein
VHQLFDKIEHLIAFGKFAEALKELHKYKSVGKTNLDDLDIVNLECWLSIQKDQDKVALEIARNNFERSRLEGTTFQQIYALKNLLFALLYPSLKKRIHSHEDYIEEFLSFIPISEKLKNQLKSEDWTEKSKKQVSKIYYVIGLWELYLNVNYLLSNEYLNKALNISRNVDVVIYAKSLRKIAEVHSAQGELNKSLEYLDKAMVFYDELPNYDKSHLLNSIGCNYSFKGENDKAVEFLKRGLEFTVKNNMIREKLMIEHNLWENLAETKGEVEQALLIFENHLKIIKNQPTSSSQFFPTNVFDDISIIWNLFNLIRYGANLLPDKKLESFLEEINDINERIEDKNPIRNQIYKIAKGILLNKSERITKKATAQQIFRDVVNQPVFDFDLTFEAMRLLGKSLLSELQMSSSEEVLEELFSLIDRMEIIAQKEKSFYILIEVYLLKAKLELIKFKFDNFELILKQAELTVQEKGLTGYLLQIERERNVFKNQFEEWNRLMMENATYYDRIKHANLVEYIKSAKKII